MSKTLNEMERQELIEKLIKSGYGDIVQVLLENENKVYTKKGRLNKSGACRKIKLKTRQLEDKLLEMKNLLKGDLD